MTLSAVIVSSHPARRCGVADYSRELVRHMPPHVHAVHRRLDLRSGLISYLVQCFRVSATLLCSRPDVFHLQYTPTTSGPAALWLVLLARLRGARTFITCHERPSTYARVLPRFARRLYSAFERILLHLAERVFVLSEVHEAELVRTYGVQPRLVHLGVREAARGRSRHAPGPTLTFAGFLRPQKGLEDIIEAAPIIAERLGRIRVQIVGAVASRDRAYVDDLRRTLAAVEEGERCQIELVEDAGDAEFERRVLVSDLFVFPSRRASQSITLNLVLEGRIPIVSAAGTGVAEIVDQHQLGAIYVPGDAQGLARAVIDLLRDVHRYHICQSNIAGFARLTGWRTVSQQHADDYEELRAA
ncbi:MAG: glycosyltransferase family 4 protein [Chloroflexi bacterium]|nr:glycosyltransferase family 4 protein [Chloroflexota bacterium]